jgi:hypothetical protein
VEAEEQHAANGRYSSALVLSQEAQGVEVVLAKRADRCKRLGSRSEVQRFRVEIGHRLLVEALSPRSADASSNGPLADALTQAQM